MPAACADRCGRSTAEPDECNPPAVTTTSSTRSTSSLPPSWCRSRMRTPQCSPNHALVSRRAVPTAPRCSRSSGRCAPPQPVPVSTRCSHRSSWAAGTRAPAALPRVGAALPPLRTRSATSPRHRRASRRWTECRLRGRECRDPQWGALPSSCAGRRCCAGRSPKPTPHGHSRRRPSSEMELGRSAAPSTGSAGHPTPTS